MKEYGAYDVNYLKTKDQNLKENKKKLCHLLTATKLHLRNLLFCFIAICTTFFSIKSTFISQHMLPRVTHRIVIKSVAKVPSLQPGEFYFI